MKIKSLEQLEEELDTDLAWRRKELANLHSTIANSRRDAKRLYLRAGMALLYAHWEGYIKNASEMYVAYIAFQQRAIGDLKSNFVALALRRNLHDIEKSGKIRYRVQMVEILRNDPHCKAAISIDSIPSTRSNLNSEVLREIVDALGLDFGPYELKKNLLDESLLSARNKIAHGEYLEIDESRFEELYREILSMMTDFRIQVGNAAVTQAFLRNPAAS